jgi:hypothetical protein
MKCVLVGVLLFALEPMAKAGEPIVSPLSSGDEAVQATIRRGLDYVAKDAMRWLAVKKCASCHQVPMALWTLKDAKVHGYAVDEKAVEALTNYVTAKNDPGAVNGLVKAPYMNQTPLMMALAFQSAEVKAGVEQAELKKWLTQVLKAQHTDGSWSTQYPWEPHGAPTDELTAFALWSLVSPRAPDLGTQGEEAQKKGLAFLAKTLPNESLQASVCRLLLWLRLKRPPVEWGLFAQEIVGQQNEDGGWSQTPKMRSDAHATGEALYALAECGLDLEPVLAKGRAFLVKTQTADGSWVMVSRAGGPRDEPAGSVLPIGYIGTTWAVMGLVHSSVRR